MNVKPSDLRLCASCIVTAHRGTLLSAHATKGGRREHGSACACERAFRSRNGLQMTCSTFTLAASVAARTFGLCTPG